MKTKTMKTTTEYLAFNQHFSMIIIKKSVKRVTIRIAADLVIYVHVPLQMSDFKINEKILNLHDWITKTLRKQLLIFEKMQIKECLNYRKIWINGMLYCLLPMKNLENRLLIKNTVLYFPDHLIANEQLIEWIRHKYVQSINELLQQLISNIVEVSDKTIQFVMKKYSSKWGVCYVKKQLIIVNSAIIHLPIEFQRYILIHEIIHLVHPNHGKLFYKLIEKYEPNFRVFEKNIKNYNFYLIKRN